LAAERIAEEKPGQTLQVTAVVHEADVRLVDVDNAQSGETPFAWPVGCRS
jgi:hypothetical protein